MTLKHYLLSIAIASPLVGCAPLKMRAPDSALAVTQMSAAEAVSTEWTEPAVTREGSTMMVLATPITPPQHILNRQIKLELDSGATVYDVVAVLANLGYSVIITDKEAADTPILVPRYHGTLGGLLNSLQRAADVWTVWENDALVVSKLENIVFSLPQERKLASRIATGLQSLGLCVSAAKDMGVSKAVNENKDGSSGPSSSSSNSDDSSSASSSCPGNQGNRKTGDPGVGSAAWEAGMITLYARPSEYQRALKFLERIIQNAAIVNLQVAMVSVTTSQETTRGIDWSKLQIAVGTDHAKWLPNMIDAAPGSGFSTGSSSSSQPGTGSTGSDAGIAIPGSDAIALGRTRSYLFNGGGLAGVVSNSAFSMAGLISFLDDYGHTKTLQSVMLRTVTGSEVELKSVTEIPYVSSVGIGSVGSTNGNSTTSSSVGQANTEKANDGITLKLLPSFDAASHTVTIDMSLAIEAVLGFNELSAGNQLGTLSQPTTAERTFNDVIRVRPGQTVVVGGLSYDQVERDSKVPLYLPDATGHKSLRVQRETMYIVIRPTVTVLGALMKDVSEQTPAKDKGPADTTYGAAPVAAE